MSYLTLVVGVLVAAVTFIVSVLSERVEGGKWDKPLEWGVLLSAFVMFLWTAYSVYSSYSHRKNSASKFQAVFQSTDSLLLATDSLELELRERTQAVDSLRKVSRDQERDLEQLASSTKVSSRLISDLSTKQSRLVKKADSLRKKAVRLRRELRNRPSTVQIMTVISPSSGRLTKWGSKSRAELNPTMGEVENKAAFVDSGLWPMYDPILAPANSDTAIDLCHLRMEQVDKRLQWAANAMAKKMHSDTEKISSPRLLLFEPCEDSRHFGQSGLSPLSGSHSLYLYSDVPVLKRIVAGKAKKVEIGFIIRTNDDITYYQMKGNLNEALKNSLRYTSDFFERKDKEQRCINRHNENEDNLSDQRRDSILKECGFADFSPVEEAKRQQNMVKLSTDTSAVVVPLRRFERIETSVDSLSQLATLPRTQETEYDQVRALSNRLLSPPQKKMRDLWRSFTYRGSKKDIGVDPTDISYFGIREGQATYYDALSETRYEFDTKYFYDYACNNESELLKILKDVTPEEGRSDQWMIIDIYTDMGMEDLPTRKDRYIQLNDFLRALEKHESKKLYSDKVCKEQQEQFGYVDNGAG